MKKSNKSRTARRTVGPCPVVFSVVDLRNAHPHDMPASPTDREYVNIANHLAMMMWRDENIEGITPAMIRLIALNITLWFEDIVADSGLWRSFTEMNMKFYGRRLPFYNIDDSDYYPDEPHLDDISFVFWKTMVDLRDETIPNPENPANRYYSEMFFDYLNEMFEEVGVNEVLADYFRSAPFADDFYLMRDVLKWICIDCYLTNGKFITSYLSYEEKALGEALPKGMTGANRKYQAQNIVAFNYKVGPLALKPQEWLAAMLRSNGQAQVSTDVEKTVMLWPAICDVLSNDDKLLVLKNYEGQIITIRRDEHCEIGEEQLHNCKQTIGSYALYRGHWQINGMSLWYEDQGFTKMIKEKQEEDRLLNSVPNYDELMRKTRNQHVFYLKDAKALKRFFEEECHQEVAPGAFNGNEDVKNIVLFIESKDKPIALLPDGALAFRDKNNPYYDKRRAEERALGILANPQFCPPSLLHYAIEHNLIPDAALKSVYGHEHGRQLVQENIDFLARALRRNDY